jgi:hypothetical protein
LDLPPEKKTVNLSPFGNKRLPIFGFLLLNGNVESVALTGRNIYTHINQQEQIDAINALSTLCRAGKTVP